TYPVGHLTTETAYWGGAAYTTQQHGFNIFGEPLREDITIPSAEGSVLGITYTFTHTYTATTGLPLRDHYPAAGGLPAENVLHGYGGVMALPDPPGGLAGYDNGVSYDAYGRVNQETLNPAPSQAFITNTFAPHPGKLTAQLITRNTATPANVDEQ